MLAEGETQKRHAALNLLPGWHVILATAQPTQEEYPLPSTATAMATVGYGQSSFEALAAGNKILWQPGSKLFYYHDHVCHESNGYLKKC